MIKQDQQINNVYTVLVQQRNEKGSGGGPVIMDQPAAAPTATVVSPVTTQVNAKDRQAGVKKAKEKRGIASTILQDMIPKLGPKEQKLGDNTMIADFNNQK